MTTEHDPIDPSTDHLDQIGRRAGAELRRPAPAEGAALVQRSVRRRRTAAAVGGSVAVVALVVGGIVLATRNRDGESVATDDATTTTAITDTNPDTATAGEPEPGVGPGTTVTPPPTVTPTTVTPTTASPATTVAPSTTVPPEENIVPTSNAGSSDEVLPDPMGFAADGFERVLVGRELIVRSDPEQVIPLDRPEPLLWLYGVGPNGVAYVRADGDGLTHILAVPTTGPTTGTVYELVEPYVHDGPWLGFMTPEGIDPFSNTGGPGIVRYVDPDGQPLAPPIDPTFTWRIEYRPDDDGTVRARFVESRTGAIYELPVTEPGREGQFDQPVRPLPDGRLTVSVLTADDVTEQWALDPATATWTVHPAG